MQAAPRSVLIVEPRAHYPNGHFPRRCAELATAYAERGYRVELLTSLGWALDAEYPTPPFTVRRWRRWARRLRRKYHDPWLFTVLLVLDVRATRWSHRSRVRARPPLSRMHASAAGDGHRLMTTTPKTLAFVCAP
jgi:hypothetical protein